MRNHKKPKRHFNIIKASGKPEPFSKNKLFQSIQHSGLSPRTCKNITEKVASELNEGFKTRDIYRKALTLVKANSQVAAVQYSLKRALFDLGPSGHNFELFVSRYFEAKGHKTKTCQLLQGKLVKHEVDVVTEKDGFKNFVECKFHNRLGIKNDIKIALYVKARWDDLKFGPEGKSLKNFYLVSNTSFSTDAMTYANGSGLKLLGINSPAEISFLDEIKEMKLFPITSLKCIKRNLKDALISSKIILARELQGQENLLFKLGLNESIIHELMAEVSILCEGQI